MVFQSNKNVDMLGMGEREEPDSGRRSYTNMDELDPDGSEDPFELPD
jgi:hypothetical protein